MQDCSSKSDFTAILNNRSYSAIEPSSESVSSLLVEHDFIIFKVVPDNVVRPFTLPLETTHSLIRAFAYDAKLVLVLELDHDFCGAVLDEIERPEVLVEDVIFL